MRESLSPAAPVNNTFDGGTSAVLTAGQTLTIAPADLDEAVFNSAQPLLLRGLVKHWPAVLEVQNSPAQVQKYLLNFYSGNPVNAAYGEASAKGRVGYLADMSGLNFSRARSRLDDFMVRLLAAAAAEQPELLYLDSTLVDNCLPGFRALNDLPLSQFNPRVGLWLGNKTIINAHYDIPKNIACVVAGRRRFTLFPPEQLQNLYIGPVDFNPAGQAISLADLTQPDFVKFPRLREAFKHAISIELQPGDAIFVPSMWWHHVEALDDVNLLINYWWNDLPAYAALPVEALTLARLAFDAMSPEQKAAWKNIFDTYVFASGDAQLAHIPADRRGILGPIDERLARQMRAQLLQKLNR